MAGSSEERYSDAERKMRWVLKTKRMVLIEWKPTQQNYVVIVQVGAKQHQRTLPYTLVDDCNVERGYITQELDAILESLQ